MNKENIRLHQKTLIVSSLPSRSFVVVCIVNCYINIMENMAVSAICITWLENDKLQPAWFFFYKKKLYRQPESQVFKTVSPLLSRSS